MTKLGILLVMWFLGLLHYTNYAYQGALGEEGFFWVFHTKDKSQAIRASKSLLCIAATSTFLVFLPIDLKIVLAISATLLFSSSVALSFRK